MTIAGSILEPAQDRAVDDRSLRRFVGYGVKRASLAIELDLTGILRDLGFRLTTFSALALVIDNPDSTQTQLAAALEIERSSCVFVVDDLEQRGLITRNRVPGDRRSYALRATPRGIRTFGEARRKVEAHEARLFAGLDDGERELIKALLWKVEVAARATAAPRNNAEEPAA